MARKKWPDEAQLFRCKTTTNDHWIKGDYVELLEVEHKPISLGGPVIDWIVMHHCGTGHSHIGYAWSLEGFTPVTDTARAMLAIAKAAGK